jgi:hypothetical protein
MYPRPGGRQLTRAYFARRPRVAARAGFWYDSGTMRSLVRSRTVLIVPLILLTVALLEDVAAYKVRRYVRDVHVRVAIVVVLQGVCFAIAAEWLGPWLKRVLASVRRTSRREGGAVGIWLFYIVAYGVLYCAYLVVETRGAGGLLPRWLR